jgi:hypothetical protein
MTKFTYTGSDSHTLAGVGLINPGDTFEVDEVKAVHLRNGAADTYTEVAEDVDQVVETAVEPLRVTPIQAEVSPAAEPVAP